jgi:hypothetical protein
MEEEYWAATVSSGYLIESIQMHDMWPVVVHCCIESMCHNIASRIKIREERKILSSYQPSSRHPTCFLKSREVDSVVELNARSERSFA